MSRPTTHRLTPCKRRVLLALDRDGDMASAEIAEAACVSQNYLDGGGLLRQLRAMSLIRVARWQRNSGGAMTPIYSVSPGEDARKPRPYSGREKTRRYKQRTGYRSRAWQAARALQQLAGGFRK